MLMINSFTVLSSACSVFKSCLLGNGHPYPLNMRIDASADAGKNRRTINRYCDALMEELTIKVKRFDSYLRLLLMANVAIITMNMYSLAIMRTYVYYS
jgi:hypothetical protein